MSVSRGIVATRVAFACVMVVMLGLTHAQTPQIDARYDTLAHELRCLVCQNQSLAESGADLAEDLKREVRSLIAQGKTDAQIKTFLSSRYGDFILYKPPVQANTLVLWLGPFFALFGGAVAGVLFLRKRKAATQQPHGESTFDDTQKRELEDRLK